MLGAISYLSGWLNKIVDMHWSRSPFCKVPLATEQDYLLLAQRVSELRFSEIDRYEEETGFVLDSDWLRDLALHTQIVKKKSLPTYAHGRILYSCLRSYLARSAIEHSGGITVVETGTARGFSALCMAKALDDAGNPGTLYTFDVVPHFAKLYWNVIDDCAGKRTRDELLGRWRSVVQAHLVFVNADTRYFLRRMHFSRVNFAFLDGGHTARDIRNEYQAISKLQQSGDIIVFDDYDEINFQQVARSIERAIAKEYRVLTKIKIHGTRYCIVVEKI